MSQIILASKSEYRKLLLTNAGLRFESFAADINERSVEKPLIDAGLTGADVADVLALTKAQQVSQANEGAYVIGSDQTLSLNGKLLHKPKTRDEAIERLLELSGKSHELNSAVCLVKDNETVWTYNEMSTITFRKLSPGFVGRHVSRVGDKVLTSVGAYQIEGEGVQLFEKVEGDFFAIMGLPLLPLLKELRSHNLLEN